MSNLKIQRNYGYDFEYERSDVTDLRDGFWQIIGQLSVIITHIFEFKHEVMDSIIQAHF